MPTFFDGTAVLYVGIFGGDIMYRVRAALILTAIVSLTCDNAEAVTVRAIGSGGPPTPVFELAAGDTSNFPVTIELFNESISDAILTLWQLDLSVVADSLATGSVQLMSVSAPVPPFLEGPGPAVSPPTVLPSTSALIQDADVPLPMMFPGKTLPASEARSIVALEFAGSIDASGSFYLMLGDFDPFEGSVWYDELANPAAFANEPSTGIPSGIVLARFNFIVPESRTVTLMASWLIYAVWGTGWQRARLRRSESARLPRLKHPRVRL